MAKRGLKFFGMGIGGLIVVAGIIVGILFATGVIKVPSKDTSTSQEESDKKDILHPTKYCGRAMSISWFAKKLNNPGIWTLSWTPGIQQQCADLLDWAYGINIRYDDHRAGGQVVWFKPTVDGQASLDISTYDLFGDIPPNVKSLEGEIWVQGIPKAGTGGMIKSNERHFQYNVSDIK